jgi:hypothetical protein
MRSPNSIFQKSVDMIPFLTALTQGLPLSLHPEEQNKFLAEEARIQRDSRPVGKSRSGADGLAGDYSLGV